MPSVASIGLPVVAFVDSNGRPAFGGRVRTFLTGTDTLAPTYTDSTGTVANPNPIPLNERGECTLWFDTSLVYDLAPELANGTDLPRQNEVKAASGGATIIAAQQAGASIVPAITALNFAGTGVTVTPSGTTAVVTIPGGGNGSFVATPPNALATTVAAQTAGGTVFVPNAVTAGTFPTTLGAVAVDFLGPNTPHPMYDETTITTKSARLIRNADPGTHPAIEHATFAVVGQPAGSGDAAVNASDFALSVSAVKKAWPTTTTVGQVVAVNIASRGGTQGSDSVNGAGDMGNLIINSVNSSLNHSNSALEAVIYNAPGGSFVPGTFGISAQLAIIKPSVNVAYGLVLVAKNGGCGPAILIGNTMGDSAGDASWDGPIKYQYSTSPTVTYEAFKVNQAGNIVMNAGPSVATPAKTLRVGPSGSLEILNNAGTVTTTFADNGPLVNETGQLVLRTGTTGTNIKTLLASGGSLQVLSSTGAVIFTIDNTGNVTAAGTISGGSSGSPSQLVLTAASGSTPVKSIKSSTTGSLQFLNNAGTTVFSITDPGVPIAEQGQFVVRSGSYPSGISLRVNSIGNAALFNGFGTEVMSVNTAGAIVLPTSGSVTFFDGTTYTQSIGQRITGWATPSGAQSTINFDPATVTLQTLAQQVLALKAALHGQAGGHGLIGN